MNRKQRLEQIRTGLETFGNSYERMQDQIKSGTIPKDQASNFRRHLPNVSIRFFEAKNDPRNLEGVLPEDSPFKDYSFYIGSKSWNI